jgi:SMI1 / KNR4 family (SUKH-1)
VSAGSEIITDVTGMDDLIERVAARAAENSDTLPARIQDEQLKGAQERLGFALHPLLARLYSHVADGGFGPDYQLLPLLGPGESVVGKYVAEREAAVVPENPRWPEGVVPILTWGCAMYACVDCFDPDGQVLLFEPNAYVWGPGDECWFLDSTSLHAWLETWLAGTGWFEPDGYDTENMPQPWAQAAARLSESSSMIGW